MDPIALGKRRELFVDDFLIGRMDGACLRLSHPERRETVFVGDAPWEDSTVFASSLVQEDARTRLYYRAASFDCDRDEETTICAMAESTDGGLSFQRPELGLVEFNGSKRNNILRQTKPPTVPPAFRDTNPACAPETRYKGLTHGKLGELFALGSEDGLRWHQLTDGPLEMDGVFDTVNTCFWDTIAGCYRSYTRAWVDPDTGRPYPFKSMDWPKAVRAIQTSTSPDFIHWSPVQVLRYRDGDLGMQLYTNAVLPCPGAEHIFVGFPNRFMAKRNKFAGVKWSGMNDALFMCSRDGLVWTRYCEAWVRPGLDQRNWTQRNNYPAWGIIRTSEEEWSILISGRFQQPDGTPGVLERLSIRPWRFVSVSAGYGGGEMLTKPFTGAGHELRFNYSTAAAGHIRVELQDESGAPVPGFACTDMDDMFGDELDATVRWKGGSDIARLAGRPIRMRLVLKDADVFSMRTV